MKIMFVFAHPDDETLSSGGTISLLHKKRHIIKLICATKGEAGMVGEPPICKQEGLGKVREVELKKAAKILGISQIFFLGLIDNTLKSVPKNNLISKISAILKKEQPDVVITFDEHGGSLHPDHIAISKAATESFEEYANHSKKHVRLYYAAMPKSYLKAYEKHGLSYTVFGKIKGTPDKKITTIISVKGTFDNKVKALMKHKTQRKDIERFFKRANQVDLKKEFFRLVSENNIA